MKVTNALRDDSVKVIKYCNVYSPYHVFSFFNTPWQVMSDWGILFLASVSTVVSVPSYL